MKIKIVKGAEADRLIESYLTEAPRKKKEDEAAPPADVNGDGKTNSADWNGINDMSLDDILDWDTFAAQQTQGVDGLFDVAYEDMPEDVNQEGDIEEALREISEVVADLQDDEKMFAKLVEKYGIEAANKSKAKPERLCLLIEGDAGSGKTARCEDWCEEHGFNILVKMLSSMDETDLGGTPYAETVKDEKGEEHHVLTKLTATELDDLERPKSVLFLDEFNRGRKTVRNTALKLTNEHCMPDARTPGGMKYFPNLWFVIMAVNPPSYGGVMDPIEPAERNRFEQIHVESDPMATRRYLWKKYRNRIRLDLQRGNRQRGVKDFGRLSIAKKVLGDPDFRFDTGQEVQNYNEANEQFLSARSLSMAIERCNGTPENFLKVFPRFCGGQPEKMTMIKMCLGDYKDIDNAMNDFLKLGTTNKDLQAKGVNGKAEEEDDEDDKPRIQKSKSKVDRILSSVDDILAGI